MLRYSITMIARPTLTSAAATTMMKNTNSCASSPVEYLGPPKPEFTNAYCIFEKATSNRFTAFSISSMHMNTIMALRRTSTPVIPMQNSTSERMI